MVGRFWLIFLISLCLVIGGLIVIITSYRPVKNSYLINASNKDGYYCTYDDYSKSNAACLIHNHYQWNFAQGLSGIVIASFSGFFFLLSSCVIIRNSLNIPIPVPRISFGLEWRQPETNLANQVTAFMTSTNTENIETINLDTLEESGNEIKEV